MTLESEIITLISTVGFPIAAFLLIYWQSNTTIKQNTEALYELIDELRRRK